MTGPDVVIVDDDPDLRALLEDYLTLQGFRVRAADGAAALERLLAERRPDLIVLDVTMPGENGFDVLARLRRTGISVGVIMLTARDEPPDRVTGLSSGADDYLVKPFQPRELLARIRSVLRRLPPEAKAPASRPALRMGRCTFDPDARCLRDEGGAAIALTAMEFDLLDVFARHPRQTLARSRLAELAHGRPLPPGDRSIDLRILRLRRKLEADPARPSAICSVHGEGYRFDPDG